MTRVHRSLLLLAVAVATVLGLTVSPAQASFTAQARTTVDASTLTVAPVTNPSTAGTRCSTTYTYSQWNNTWYASRTLHARVSWSPSTTRGVTGYQLTAVFRDGSTFPLATVGPGTTSLTQDVDGSYADQGIRVRITTLTSYGWTSAPAQTGAVTC
ncbi:hypothetical protein [Modestobacter roseus]|uniref:Ig-like domain-containing protein n=1 Tax=Modestobacter roseus TaxID=1181884 RepID=A0A562ILJ8_9ACTN|nr:hypothetical protein [Modestobacter roseus]TWH71887.1 hypothetical protein JD78_00387 [Modestobacter roseus]